MVPYTDRAQCQDVKENYDLARSCTYDLLCVVVHVGEIDTGHYITYCRKGDQVSSLPTLSTKKTDKASGTPSMITGWSWPASRTS